MDVEQWKLRRVIWDDGHDDIEVVEDELTEEDQRIHRLSFTYKQATTVYYVLYSTYSINGVVFYGKEANTPEGYIKANEIM